MKINATMIGIAVALGVAGFIAWPMVKMELVRRKAGAIEENGYLYDPETETYYDTNTGKVQWRPGM